MSRRLLSWDGCVNTRDLGGLPLRRGGTTAFRRVVRSDNVRHLSPRGWEQLHGHGVRTILDLRFAEERAGDPPPPGGLEVIGISLFGVHDPAEAARVDELVRRAADATEATALLYADTLETCRAEVCASVRAVAQAGAGGVVVHCFVGKDRTGIVTALLLDLVGVEPDAIADDYALTEGRVGSLVDSWVADAVDPHERDYRHRISSAPRAAMESLLDLVGSRYGDARGYLRDAGVGEEELDAIRRRLVDDGGS
ncbi:MAG: tyrosine-protein phosphatase [Gaiella sp.]